MLKIRMQRVGRKHEPVFRLVLTDSKNSPKSGKFLEILGSFDARRGEDAKFDEEKVKYWIGKGTQVSDTVHNILIEKKVISGKKINKLPKKSPIIKEKSAEETIESPATKSEEAKLEPQAENVGPEEAPTKEKTDDGKQEEVKEE